MRVTRMAIAGAAVAMTTAGGILGVGSGASAAERATMKPQSLRWHGCQANPNDETGQQLDAAGAQCAELTVPLDYSRPRGQTITVAMSRLKAGNPAHRRGTLMINPGGPGGPGRVTPLMIQQSQPAVAARYDLIGMDPRFVGLSTPLNCGWPVRGVGSAGPNRRTFDETAALARNLAFRCAGQQKLLPHASTRNTARDMDAIRAAVGETRLSYLGVSYGSYLGAVYLQMFPERADRVVLDSAIDPDVYGPDGTRESAPSWAAALKDWAAWAAGHDNRYHLGASTQQVLDTVSRINAVTDRRPLTVGKHQLDAHELPLILQPLGSDSEDAYASFAADVQVLNAAALGREVVPTESLDSQLAFSLSPDVDGATSAQNAILCADRAPSSRRADPYYRDIQTHRADEPLYGPLLRNLSPCTYWPTAPAEPPTRVRNASPALIVAATGDPAADYPGQLATHRALSGSRLITLKDSFRHGVYGPFTDSPNACVDTAVNRYLLDGSLPTTDLTCVKR
jgi:pimeloyl-ACP methyl ester carboxylesterase